MRPTLAEYRSRLEASELLATLVAGQLADAIAARGRATLAVPGGTTPGSFLTALSLTNIDWIRVSVVLTDERFVPESSDRSNTRLLRTTLFRNKARNATLIPMRAEAERPEQVLDDLEAPLAAALPLDVCVLGMGADMHTASLFPGADRLDEALSPECAALILPMRAPGAPEPRLTLTAPVLSAARNIHLLIFGAEKYSALAKAEAASSALEAPVRAVLSAPCPVTIHFAE